MTLYAGTTLWGDTSGASALFKSTDGGETWYAFDSGLTVPGVFMLAVNPVWPQIVYAGTYDGLFTTQSDTMISQVFLPEIQR